MHYEDLKTLLDYHYWARDRMLAALEPLTPEQYAHEIVSSFRSLRDTAVHIYGADLVWYLRWTGTPPTSIATGAQIPDVDSLRDAWRDLEHSVREFTAETGASGADRVIEYRMLDGKTASSLFSHMVQHVVNHASYHRGQITTLLRQIGAAPPQPMDLIRFYREQSPDSRPGH
jgi:uncharacterized damage-inducible protein DinB